MRQIVVIGLGQFGGHLAQRLGEFNCEVLAIDFNERRVAEIRDKVQRAIIADARNMDMLQSVVSPSVDEVVVSLGESMESSILCTLHLSRIGIQRIRSKAINEDHASILKAVGATETIFPERDTAERTARRIAHPHLLDYFPFAEDYRIMEIVTPTSLAGASLSKSGLRQKYSLLVLAIRNPESGAYQFMPGADALLKPNDVLIVFGREVDLARLSALD